MKVLIFDTETTGLPKLRQPSSRGPNNWPHIVSISWVILDADTNKVIDLKSHIVKPRNWIIPQDSVKIHGITQEKAVQEGVDLQIAISEFLAQPYDILVAHNLEFDYNVLHNAINWDLGIEFKGITKPKYCTMELSKDICKLNGMFGYKSPKLIELYEYTFKRKPDTHSLHNSLYDAMILGDIIECNDELRRKMNLPSRQQSTTTNNVRPKNDSRVLSIRLEIL